MSINDSKKKTAVGSLTAIIGLCLSFIIYLVSNVIGSAVPSTPLWSFILSVILLIIAIICWIGVSFIIWLVRKHDFINYDENRKKKLLESEEIKDLQPCEIYNGVCCLDALLNVPGMKIEISEIDSKDHNLFYPEDIRKIEAQDKWKYIWIFSEDLYTEVDHQTGGLESVVMENIKKIKGVEYAEFYCSMKLDHADTESRIEKIKKGLNKRQRKRLNFFPFQHDGNYIGKNTVPLLCGSILFSSYKDSDGIPSFEEGYLSMRFSRDYDPIYYKMPRCMRREYAKFFKEEKQKEEKQRELNK